MKSTCWRVRAASTTADAELPATVRDLGIGSPPKGPSTPRASPDGDEAWDQPGAEPVLALPSLSTPTISKKVFAHFGWAANGGQRVFFHALSVMLFMVGLPIWAASASLPSASGPDRDRVVAEIKSYAQRHVKTGAPLQTKLILDLFSQQSTGLREGEIATLYEEEYARAQDARKKTTWATLRDQFWSGSGWAINLILLLVIFFRDFLRETSTALAKKALELGFSGASFVFKDRFAVLAYRKASLEQRRWITVPFRPGKPLDLQRIFVPLQMEQVTPSAQSDALQAVRDRLTFVVLGPPGSGKSILLKYLVLSYAKGELDDLPGRPVPIIVELHKFQNPADTIETVIANALDSRFFRRPRSFAGRGLKRGSIMLLLDGFDEVVPSLRGHIASEILRLRRDYPKCRCIVTCRTASYSNEFSEFDETYHLVEFTDQQIRRFLTCWDLPPGTSPDHLLASLRDRPRILELAKNPLLLTMIAWLHFDEKTHLPDRRSQFYLQATELLLRRWEEATHKGNPQFRSEVKRKILQRLALLAQDSSVEEGVDRRIIKYQRLCGTAEKVLNEEGHEGRDLRPILQEIVERSGLLLSFDGGERYQFAHLTLQEYFASECLSDDWKGVLERVARDPDTWRETAKLWVGRAENPAGFLEELAKTDALLALECLAEASQVPELVGDRLIVALKPQLQNSAEAERVARVFGLAASSRTPFGNRVLDLLLNEFSNARDDSARRRLALSLSSTNLPEAAAVLAGAYRQHKSETREFLVRLGDLAVNELARLAETGESDALDDLLSIGTPKAALCLAKMIGDRLDSLAQAASWRLAGLTFLPEIERCLRPPLPKELQALQAQPCLAWPWQPFERFVEIDASVPRRIAHLMNISSPDHVPQSPLRLDPRIVVPLCLELSQSELDSTVLGPSADLAEEVSEKIPDSPGLGPRLRVLLSSLDRELRKEVFGVLRRGKVSGHTPHRDDWAAYSGPASFDLWRSWQYRLLFVGACLASAASFIESGRLILELLTQGAIWQGTLLLIACWVFAISCFYLLRAHFTARARGVLALLGGPVWPLACKQARPRYRVSRIDALLGYCISSAWFVFSTLFVTRCVSRYVGDGWLLIGAWFLPFNCALPLAGRALYLDQKARNPLQRIFALLRPNARR